MDLPNEIKIKCIDCGKEFSKHWQSCTSRCQECTAKIPKQHISVFKGDGFCKGSYNKSSELVYEYNKATGENVPL